MNSVSISDQEYKEFSRFLESQCGIVLGIINNIWCAAA